MPDVDPNAVAKAGRKTLQDAIDKLNALKREPGADIDKIDTKIEALLGKQDALTSQELRATEDSDANRLAIAALNTAAAKLTAEAANIKDAATALEDAAKVVDAAGSLVAALAPFI
jgi:hypothetical protein